MDYPFDPNADTGDFVLAYKQVITEIQPNTGLCLTALGKAMLTKSKIVQQPNWQYLWTGLSQILLYTIYNTKQKIHNYID